MKNITFINQSLFTLLVCTMSICCMPLNAQQNKKVAKARVNVVEAQKELKEAKLDSVADFKQFRLDAETNIHENDLKIAKLKANKSSKTIDYLENYAKRVEILQKKNDALKLKIRSIDGTKVNAWSSFKREFKQEMDDFGQAVKDFGVDFKE